MSEQTSQSGSDSGAEYLDWHKTLSMESRADKTKRRRVAIFFENCLLYPLMAAALVAGMIFGLFAEAFDWLRNVGGRAGDSGDTSLRPRFIEDGGERAE